VNGTSSAPGGGAAAGPRPPSPLRRSLRASVLDGTCNAAMLGFGELYFPAFALLLGVQAISLLLQSMLLLAGVTSTRGRVDGEPAKTDEVTA